jgi:hypothetical protein
MHLRKSTYDGKELYYNYLCGRRCYFHKDLVHKINDSTYIVYVTRFPLIGCDLADVDGNLVIVPGNYNLFTFSCEGVIEKIDNAIQVIKSNENDCALILTKQDKMKIKWSNREGQWTTLLTKDGKQEDIPTEKLLKYL